MTERTDQDGRWRTDVDGVWTLVEPSQDWRDRRAADEAAAAATRSDAEAERAAVESRTAALALAARIATVDKVRADTLTDEQVASIAPLFDPWQPGLTVAVGDVLSWDGTLVEVIQAHTTQSDWQPNLVPALFKIHRTDDGSGPIPWQPGISVVAGEQVTYNGVTYTVVQSHTTQAGWEPPNVPSLFTPV
jgi:hypothetical protein